MDTERTTYQMPDKGIGMSYPLSDGTTVSGKIMDFNIDGDEVTIKIKLGGLTEGDIDFGLNFLRDLIGGNKGRVVELAVKLWGEALKRGLVFR